MELNNIIFSLLLLLFGLFINKYFLSLLSKTKSRLLIDNQFSKPQAFHEYSTYRLGGTIFFILLSITFLYLFFIKNIYYFEFISFCTLFFLLGLIDDLKINFAPKFRLIIMIIFLITLVILNEFYLEKITVGYLDRLMKIDIFALFFICLCFLFIINGSNLIDGFNGLLGIHAFIIFVILFFINFIYTHDIQYILFYLIIITFTFIIFNFPKAKIFLGDSGAYLIGTLIAISTIITNNSNPSISSFFFCILLFYLFFEVFFSFFRKSFVTKTGPFFPDNEHLHMLLYKFLLKKGNNKLSSNYKVSLYTNLVYLCLITPGILFMHNALFCRFYFFFLLIIYIFFYRMLLKKS
ncbi:MAG: glycosyltransferase [Pelagibacteraceae bacterium]|jgi:UDP-N-acetylmuramyl pentapeptide phosphotransferase/UDP-N-acetylglucosamine-1-phosphate transferase|nr:glycosyltransferase [Pelagibacteraceae bacterium]|tara:strand:+ start:805 stop:1857 length:1053 start_codon:yes stop_codon:yes gene_type:complete